MSDWTQDQLDTIGNANELRIAPRRRDGALRTYTTVWVVRVGNELLLRSWRGPQGGWYRAARRNETGRIRAAGTEHEVAFAPAGDIGRELVDAAYRTKYGRSSYVDAMTSDEAAATTTRLSPI